MSDDPILIWVAHWQSQEYLREKVPFVESLPFSPCFSTEPWMAPSQTAQRKKWLSGGWVYAIQGAAFALWTMPVSHFHNANDRLGDFRWDAFVRGQWSVQSVAGAVSFPPTQRIPLHGRPSLYLPLFLLCLTQISHALSSVQVVWRTLFLCCPQMERGIGRR